MLDYMRKNAKKRMQKRCGSVVDVVKQTDERKKLMQLGVFKTQADSMMYLIARSIDRTEGPVGSWSLKIDLDDSGVESSTATIGRYLKMLDAKEYTIQKSNQGRILTPAGKIWLDGLENRIARARVREDIGRRIHVNEYTEMVDLMRVRKLIEVEAARLAAENADAEDLKRLEEALAIHHQYVEDNMDPVDPALDFHLAVTQASHNKFMFAVLSLLAFEEKQIESAIEVLRTREMGSVYVVEHDDIMQAIRAHDSKKAERLMEIHMQAIVSEVEKQVAEFDESGDMLPLWHK